MPQQLYKQLDREHTYPDLQSSMAEVRLAVQTPFWQDVQVLLARRVTQLRDDLEVMGAEYAREDIAFTQGKIVALREVLDIAVLFETLIAATKDEAGEEKNAGTT